MQKRVCRRLARTLIRQPQNSGLGFHGKLFQTREKKNSFLDPRGGLTRSGKQSLLPECLGSRSASWWNLSWWNSALNSANKPIISPDRKSKRKIFHQVMFIRDPSRFPGDSQNPRWADSSPQTLKIPQISLQTATVSPRKNNTRRALKT